MANPLHRAVGLDPTALCYRLVCPTFTLVASSKGSNGGREECCSTIDQPRPFQRK
jgi:hypothetical protein